METDATTEQLYQRRIISMYEFIQEVKPKGVLPIYIEDGWSGSTIGLIPPIETLTWSQVGDIAKDTVSSYNGGGFGRDGVFRRDFESVVLPARSSSLKDAELIETISLISDMTGASGVDLEKVREMDLGAIRSEMSKVRDFVHSYNRIRDKYASLDESVFRQAESSDAALLVAGCACCHHTGHSLDQTLDKLGERMPFERIGIVDWVGSMKPWVEYEKPGETQIDSRRFDKIPIVKV